jgi:hypothetical protein
MDSDEHSAEESTTESADESDVSRRTVLSALGSAGTVGVVAGMAGTASASSHSGVIFGRYRGSDGGRYYFQELNDQVWFFGEKERTDESTCDPLPYGIVFRGTRTDNVVRGTWATVPKGRQIKRGDLAFRVLPSGTLERTSQSGGFPTNRWVLTTGIPRSLRGFREAGFESFDRTDLSGTWTASDGGTYYIRQFGNRVVWFGERSNLFSNVFFGQRSGDVIDGRWSDVPKERTRGVGSLRLRVVDSNELRRISRTGGFGGENWGKITSTCLDT